MTDSTKCRLSGKEGGEIYFFFFRISQKILRSNAAVVLVSNGKLYGKVGLKVLIYRAKTNLIKSTNVAIWNDVPLCYIQC